MASRGPDRVPGPPVWLPAYKVKGDRSAPCQVSASRRSLCQRHKHIGRPTASSPRWHRRRSEPWLMTLPTPCSTPCIIISISTGLGRSLWYWLHELPLPVRAGSGAFDPLAATGRTQVPALYHSTAASKTAFLSLTGCRRRGRQAGHAAVPERPLRLS